MNRQSKKNISLFCFAWLFLIQAIFNNAWAGDTKDIKQLAIALGISPSDLISGSLSGSDPQAFKIYNTPVGKFFPNEGSSFVVMSTGLAENADDHNNSGNLTTELNGLNNSQGKDLVQLMLELQAPVNANCANFHFAFYSEEFPEYVGQQFNDTFIAEINKSSFRIIGQTVKVPNNFAFDTENNLVSVNTVFGVSGNTSTTYDGGTPLLTAQTPIIPGNQFKLILSIMDLGDSNYDSAVFIDNFFWSTDACSGGAKIVNDNIVTPIASSTTPNLDTTTSLIGSSTMFNLLLWFFILPLLLWAGIGSLLLYLKNKPTGTAAYLRKVDKRIYNRAETVNVTLELTPPVATPASVDKHDVLLVLDHSGSMGSAPGSPLRESVRAMENFVKQLPKSYHIGLIIFDHEAQRLCNITPQKEEVLGALKTISPGGATELHLALDISREALDEGRGEVKKTLILLSDGGSDRKAADHSAAQVKEHPSKPTIICVGFGAHVDEDLMKSVASTEQHYIHVETADHLAPLFELLVGVVSGQSASAVLVNEKMMAPRPFHLDKTGEIYPVGIHQTETNGTEVAWFLSLLQRETVSLNYRLQPECLGWHTVAPADAQAHWKMPEGDQQTTDCAAGPKVLILPNGFAWTGWWLLNPLFWLIFGPLFKCVQPTAAQDKTELEDLPVPDVPKPLSVPESTLYVPKLRPALVIGLGALGEWSLSRLKWQLQDRQIDKDVVDLLVIQDSSVHNRPSVTVNGGLLDDSERVILQADLRPYLEELRHQDNTPDSRSWIPWRQWLRESRPLTTYTDDRRKARLALLLQPEAVEKRIKDNVARILKDEGIILIVAGAGDAEGSGMLAEVAHICASHGAGVTAILVPERTSSPETTGMVKELERILIMRGESIPSDRGGKTVSANKLFDRVIVANQFQENAKITSKAISHLLWDILAYPEMLEKMPSARNDDCYQVKLQGQALPQRSLWHWVRERTLSDLINQQWLKSTITANQVEQPVVNTDAVKEYVATFWNGDTELLHQRLPSKLLKKSALVVRHANPLIILEEALEIPLEKPYHEQKAYCDLERVAFSAYLEAWCYYMLEREKGQWGLPTLLEAVTHIEQDFEKLIESVNRLSGNTALVEQLSFISSIYTDYHVALGGLRSSLEHWIAVFVGWQPGMKVNPLPQDFVPACIAIEKQRQQAEADLPFQRVQDTLVPFYKNWYDQYGNNFLQQLRFQVKPQSRTNHSASKKADLPAPLGPNSTVRRSVLIDTFANERKFLTVKLINWFCNIIKSHYGRMSQDCVVCCASSRQTSSKINFGLQE
jgi:uncharacterized protein YegL